MNKRCLGCREIYEGIGKTGRCDACRRALDRNPARRARKRMLYGSPEYRRTRAAWQQAIAAGARPTCPRCGLPIEPGQQHDLGHQPDGSLLPEHAAENRGNR